MVAANGAGSAFQADTVEGRLVELLFTVALFERQVGRSSRPAGAGPAISWKIEPGTSGAEVNTHYFTGTFSLAAAQQLDGGKIKLVPDEYLTLEGARMGYNSYNFYIEPSGAGNDTFSSTTPISYLLEMLAFCQAKELQQTSNPGGRDYVAFSWDSATGLVVGSFRIPLKPNLDDQGPGFQAVEWITPFYDTNN